MKKDSSGRSDRAVSADLNQNLKIRARRRLIGAITLVLTAVIIVPMLLDSEQRPLNQNIPVEIPSKDTPFAPKLEPVKPAARSSDAIDTGPGQSAQPETEPPQAQNKDTAGAIPPQPRVQAPAATKSDAAPAKANVAAPAQYLIQVAAYSKESPAYDWVKKLKAGGLQAYTEKVTTPSGVRIRVRVGPYSTQAEADKALAQIKLQGASEARLVN